MIPRPQLQPRLAVPFDQLEPPNVSPMLLLEQDHSAPPFRTATGPLGADLAVLAMSFAGLPALTAQDGLALSCGRLELPFRSMASASGIASLCQPSGKASALRLVSHSGAVLDKGRTCQSEQSTIGQQETCSRQLAPASQAPQSRHFPSIAARRDGPLMAHPLPVRLTPVEKC